MNKPSVNILIFTYNQESLVKDTIESVIKPILREYNKNYYS